LRLAPFELFNGDTGMTPETCAHENETPSPEDGMTDSTEALLKDISRDIRTLLSLVSQAVNAMNEAQAEVPEKMRRFVNYMHDVHDIMNFYREVGQEAPPWVKREAERCDDRFRQLLEGEHTDGGTFEKVRREMAKDPANRWDHTRLITKQENP